MYADWLAAHVEEWTVTTAGELVEGFRRHYIRINPTDPEAPDPHADPNTTMLAIANGGGVHPARNVVGGDFLHLVRLGIRAADDPDYVTWLAKRHPMVPRILFTYRVWGSTRMADRDMDVDDDVTARSDLSKLRALTEIVLGVRHRGWLVYEKVRGEIEYEIYESMDLSEVQDDAVIEGFPSRAW